MNPRSKNLIGLAIALAIFALAAQWWMHWPRQSLQRFISLARDGSYAEASALLDGSGSIESADGGGLRILDTHGREVLLPPNQQRFVAGEAVEKRLPPRQFADRLFGRDRAALTALGPSTDGVAEVPPVTIYLSVERGRLAIESVE
ncbi:hypothetical protein [Engelhardtia mirabilis]|uniref:Uncharacterized protein n=1 Tax=Engelhardtia mirabilis TaxID=2528011 RepID=A0A518BFX2_9BACT|nr:hypothetical protein Pla133_09400 [Planctomycetes bacterium Pla133]QDV00200.1 hypothetical protein Pla86_09390 [Planctomycetes bacterium Pla86]